ncbi:MAG TPA: RNA-binding protein [Methylomirabilota bacterium]|nr:RNA-binding protein [Methylomirabilota bacterium]
MAQKLFVGGLSFSTTNESLQRFFTQAGTVASATVIVDQMTGRSKGFGFVEMATSEEAQTAVSQLDGRELDGRQVKVEVAKPKADGGGRGGFGRRGGGGGGGRGGWR